MTKQTFIKGAMILLAAGVINRILGFVPRIALPRVIGAEGVGLYQLCYPFLGVLITLITGGIPIAVAKWVAEAESQGDNGKVRHIFRTAMGLTVALALVMTGIMLLGAEWITTKVLTDPRVYEAFLVMSPMLLLIGVSSVYRGYFQGRQNMIPTAQSQVVETVLRIAAQLTLAALLLPKGLQWAAAGAMMGTVLGEVAALAVMLFHARKDRRRNQQLDESNLNTDPSLPAAYPEISSDNGADAPFAYSGNAPKAEPSPHHTKTGRRFPIMRRLLRLSMPITGSRLVGSLSYLLESILTARSLAVAGIATGAATAQYGALQGMIIPLLLLPTALTYSLSVSLIPSLSAAAAKGDRAAIHKRLHQSLRLALVTGAPFVVIMGLLAEPICRVLYRHAEIAPLLALLAPAGIFIYLQGPLQATLQALDKPGTALINTTIGAAVKLFLIYELASRPELGIYGAVIAITVNIILVTLLHGISVLRCSGYRMKLPDFVKVGAAMIIMGAACRWIMSHHPLTLEWLGLLAACGTSIVLYLLLMAAMGIIDRHDLQRLPGIGRWL
ncbi:polysaccharide biosynthesis protein [Paenibacillus pasadenensis]|uniref:putative polysaccharide biosynthesis protein n=1 Tax=Paenibacillus pasadenensis TaxID=217090 RepID=UPI00204205C5|nr:polysaccharide biosynthesis protein [Paenibacillus pasadenensis]MCM3746681.1 polysaccharide biosynthesis protein [Paenibacillus pasadenensis]